MKTQVAETSLRAFRDLQHEGALAPQEQRVVEAIRQFGAMTRDEIAERTGMRLSAVCGRCKSLIDAGRLQEQGTRINPQSLKANKLVCLPLGQMELFH